MKRFLILTFILFNISLCQCQGRGFSFSYSIVNVAELDIFVRDGNNRFHLGYRHQFNGQKIEVIKNPKETYGLTEIGEGDYFLVIDLGYSRIFMNKTTVHPEISIGAKNEFTSYQDDRFSDNGYSLITSSKVAIGFGLNLGYLVRGFEPFIGYHTLKKMNFGIRFSW